MSEDFGSLGIDNRPRMTFAVLLLASPPNATSGKRNVMRNFAQSDFSRLLQKNDQEWQRMKIDIKSFVLRKV